MRQAAAGVETEEEGGGDTQYYLEFNGTTSGVDCGSDSSLDDLHSADFTAEGWFWYDAAIDSTAALLIKGVSLSVGWALFRLTTVNKVYIRVNLDSSDATTNYDLGGTGAWFHVAATYDAATKTTELFVDGTSRGSNTGSGDIVSDAGDNLVIGQAGAGASLAGRAAWIRLSNNKRYTSNFTPDAKDSPPAVDANTIEQWNFNDGSGATATAEVNSSNNGTITDGSWGVL